MNTIYFIVKLVATSLFDTTCYMIIWFAFGQSILGLPIINFWIWMFASLLDNLLFMERDYYLEE